MKPIEEKILLYSELSSEERKEVDAYVASHPELADLLEEVRAFESLVKEAQAFAGQPPGDAALAYYVATRFLERHPMPDGLREVFARVEAALEKDAALRERYEVFERRMREIEAASDAIAQFERLAGYTLEPPGEGDTSRPPALRPSKPRRVADRASRRPARIHRPARRPARWAVAASLAFVALYGALFVISETTRSSLDRTLRLDEDAGALYGPHVRSGNGGFLTDPADSLYFRAMDALGEARKSTLGLFPHYDAERLREAAGYLQEVIGKVEPNSFLYLEAQFFLGKIYLAQGNLQAAEAAFEAVVNGQGSRMDEAREMLRMLRAPSTESAP